MQGPSSFVRRPRDGVAQAKTLPVGCFASPLSSSVLLASSGLHALDDLLGGGLAVGSLTCLEQDSATRHWLTVARLFAGQGMASGQGLAVVGAAGSVGDPDSFEAPAVSQTEPESGGPETRLEAEGVKIAWRYRAQLREKSDVSGSSSEPTSKRRSLFFDLSKNMAPEQAAAAATVKILFRGNLEETFLAAEREVERFNLAISDPNVRAPPILRLLLLDFGSGYWQPKADLFLFLLRLRALVRRSLCVCLVCVAPSAKSEFAPFFDQTFALSSFEGSGNTQASSAFPGYTGILVLKKTLAMFSATQWRPECRQYLFRRTRRTFQLERLYMPPEDKAQNASGGAGLACATSGGAGGSGLLDF